MKILKRVLGVVLALFVAAMFLFPLLWVVLASFKTKLELLAVPPVFIFQPTLQNYINAFNSDFPMQVRNSLIIAISSTVISIILGSLTAYGFSRYAIKGSDFLQFWILSLRMLPAIAVVVPFYLVFRMLGLLDTHIALILVYCLFNISFAVWVLKGFFDEIPLELEEAAMLDGSGHDGCLLPYPVVERVSARCIVDYAGRGDGSRGVVEGADVDGCGLGASVGCICSLYVTDCHLHYHRS